MNDAALNQLKSQMRGEVLDASSPAYDSARKVYNGMIDRRPLLIAKCQDVADVIACVNFARGQDLLVSIRGGGHNAAGLGVCDGGLVIDLCGIRYTHVDPARGTVRAGGGCTWGEVDHATHAYGLAVPAGIIASTGIGGLTLGGGLGHLTRKYGLTIDNLLAVDMVLADGSMVTASADQNPDLFWAVRGGGGNFGVVTSFLYRAHPVHTDYAGPMLWHLDRAPEIMRWYRDFILTAPEELTGFFAFLIVPPGPPFPEAFHLKPMCGVVWCYSGDAAEGARLLAGVRAKYPPDVDLVGPLPHPVVNSLFDPLMPAGLQWYWKADFVNQISDAAIGLHTKHAARIPTMLSTMHLYPIDGAAHRVDKAATPWSYREANWAQVIVGIDPDPANRDAITTWARDYFEDLHPHSAGGAYVNFMMEEGEERIRATYRENYDRLAAIKAKYDPDNLFRVNQNIRPGKLEAGQPA
jgi:FAD/FMN-containing dehydrogenase